MLRRRVTGPGDATLPASGMSPKEERDYQNFRKPAMSDVRLDLKYTSGGRRVISVIQPDTDKREKYYIRVPGFTGRDYLEDVAQKYNPDYVNRLEEHPTLERVNEYKAQKLAHLPTQSHGTDGGKYEGAVFPATSSFPYLPLHEKIQLLLLKNTKK